MTATVQIPGKPITLIEAAQLLAGTVSKDDPDAVTGSLNFILEKAHSGKVRGRHPLTLVPFDTAGILPADYVNLLVLTPNDLRQLATECDLQVEADDVLKSAHSTQATFAPAQNTEASAPAVVSASNAQEMPMKKAALIAALEHEWESIEADLSEATRNGLKAAAHAGTHGEWHKSKARAWAVSRGKIKQAAPEIHPAIWAGTVTRNRL